MLKFALLLVTATCCEINSEPRFLVQSNDENLVISYLVENNIAIEDIKAPLRIFNGTPRDAATACATAIDTTHDDQSDLVGLDDAGGELGDFIGIANVEVVVNFPVVRQI